ncbi:phage tail assembly chaperone [Phenylobacterium sp.]|uniref:phage tail assembly chaperone n=1 Tax=Phenylobacterium sp. TaxID=1871053 RepID=UPI0035B0B0F3
MEAIEIAGHTYKIGRLDARRQFHVARRLVPIMGALAGALQDATANLLEALGPIGDAMAAMPDTDADYVVSACLSTVERQIPGGAGWGPVQASNGGLMYDDIDLATMLRLVAAVIRENLGDFFSGLASMSGQEAPGATA